MVRRLASEAKVPGFNPSAISICSLLKSEAKNFMFRYFRIFTRLLNNLRNINW